MRVLTIFRSDSLNRNPMDQYKPRNLFAKELGMSYSTFCRRLKTLKVKVTKGLLRPATQEAIKKALNSLDDGAASDDKLG